MKDLLIPEARDFKPISIPQFTAVELEVEADRLFKALAPVDCHTGQKWTYERCLKTAPLTLEIQYLKAVRGATILAHSYVDPEIVYGVSDFRGDSYKLSKDAYEAKSDIIVFSGVVFMAETAKILSPHATVLVPDRKSGCSLADSLTAAQMQALKAQYPDATPVCYINCNADIKAECEVCVTSTNVYDIIAKLPTEQVLFVPDRLMGENIRTELRRRGVQKTIFTSDGTCEVHDQFHAELIEEARQRYPGLRVVSHPECLPEIIERSDFVGSTSAMMNYVQDTEAPYFMMLTECGLVSRLEVENPEKQFIGSCKLCPYMKRNTLEKIRDVLQAPRPEQFIELDESLRQRAARCIERMFELTEA